MRNFFGYIRVSTAKRGEKGVSLQEGRAAIEREAQRLGLEIASWFEERETGAKRGRPVLHRMLQAMRPQRKKSERLVRPRRNDRPGH
jgi:site-specific DNA recombinase